VRTTIPIPCLTRGDIRRTAEAYPRICKVRANGVRQDQTRTDFAAIESDLEVIQRQLSRLPTRRELTGTALGIIFGTTMLDDAELAVLSAVVGRI
jgi:hypothetical protein